MDENWTVGRLLEWTTAFFGRRGFDTPRLDAEVLLAKVLSCRRIDLYVHYDSEVAPGDRAVYRELVQRRGSGCPAAYLVGAKEFYGLRMELSEATLIPRPETELLVMTALDFARQEAAGRFLDLGTGCGAIAVALAHELPQACGVAVDICPEALEVARRNAQAHGVADRIEFIESDLFDRIPPGPPFDLIVSNPPYVAGPELDGLPIEVRQFEPRKALDGGPSGLDVLRRLVPQVPGFLRSGGLLVLEIAAAREQAVLALLQQEPMFEPAGSVRDLAGLPRVVSARRCA